MSNVERQRKFRVGHPGYYRKYYRIRKAMRVANEAMARTLAMTEAAAAAESDTPAETAPGAEPIVLPVANAVSKPEPFAEESDRQILLFPAMRLAA
jgi:hypothetical protein